MGHSQLSESPSQIYSTILSKALYGFKCVTTTLLTTVIILPNNIVNLTSLENVDIRQRQKRVHYSHWISSRYGALRYKCHVYYQPLVANVTKKIYKKNI